MPHSAVTRRRLRDGEKAFEASEPARGADLAELQSYRAQLCDGIVALQSLDDLGSERANQAAWDDMLELQKKLRVLDRRIKKRKRNKTSRAG